jgi:hypothetical protein
MNVKYTIFFCLYKKEKRNHGNPGNNDNNKRIILPLITIYKKYC